MKKKLVLPLIILAVLLVVGTSFALWQLTFTQSGTNVITTGCLKLTLTEETDAINLVGATPISDEEGKKLEPFTFTLENVCTTETKYVVNLETLSTGDKILADNYVKANLVSGENELFVDNLLETHINEEKVIEEATTAYKLHQGKLGNKEKISFNLRLWMDEATEALDEVMNASWQGKITVTAEYVPPVDMTNMMIEMSARTYMNDYNGYLHCNNLTYTQNEKYVVSTVVFQSKMNPLDDAIEVVDFSEAQDRGVLGYYVKNEPENENSEYTLYIQADGKIKVNPNASYYCANNTGSSATSFEGLENLDTSLVTDMSYMFYTSGNQNLDLSTFDTSNVISMAHMFDFCLNLVNLNVDGFDTKNVLDMSYMFSECYELTNISYGENLIYKIGINVEYMFNCCRKLTTAINITNPNIENYERMFASAATNEGSQITVNYTAEASDLVDRIIATKYTHSNIVKGSLIS